jgi:CrcB protein
LIQLLIAIGGAVGAGARYEVGRAMQPAGAGAFPWATFLINIVGSFILGLAYRYIDGTTASANMRALIGIGFCGGFTTFSTFSYDAVRLFQDGQPARAALYVAGSVGICIAGTFAGIAIGSMMLRR